jgi:hypothetical protein
MYTDDTYFVITTIKVHSNDALVEANIIAALVMNLIQNIPVGVSYHKCIFIQLSVLRNKLLVVFE